MSVDKINKPEFDNGKIASDPNMLAGGKTKNSFVQNPNQNNQIHKEALGPNAKR